MDDRQRRATVMLIQRGDPQIAGALMAGVVAGKAEAAARTASDTACGATFPKGEGFEEAVETVEVYAVEQDKWRRVARQVHVAVGRNLTAEDYRLMIVKARCEYATHRHSGPAHAVARKLLLAWVMLCQGVRRAYRAQEKVLRP